MNKEYGLIGHLYHEILKEPLRNKGVKSIQSFFMDYLICNCEKCKSCGEYAVYFNKVIKKDCYMKDNCRNKEIEKNLSNGSIINQFKDLFRDYDYSYRKGINDSITELISTYQFEDSKIKKSFLAYMMLTEETFDIAYNIFLVIYYSYYKKMPEDFNLGYYYGEHLKEYNDEVTKKYSANSYGGKIVIKKLATEKLNIIALHEYADMLYYGDNFNKKPDYNKAFLYYRISAGENLGSNEGFGVCHPLALWSLAYIYFNYKRNGVLKNATINELDVIGAPNDVGRIKKAVDYCNKAIELKDDFGPAYNILGNISRYLYERAELDLIKKLDLLEPEKYYVESAKNNYLFAYVNLAEINLVRIFNEKTLEKKIDYLMTAIEYYKKLDELCDVELTVTNKLALIYLTGNVTVRINERKMTEAFNIDSIVKDAREEAHSLLRKATSTIIEEKTVWPIVNRICYFPEDYIDDFNLLRKHLEIVYSFNLNPQIDFLEKNASILKSGVYKSIFEEVKNLYN